MLLATMWLGDQQKQSFALVRHTLDVESGQRGFLLTGQPESLVPYEAAIGRIDGSVRALGAATADNPRQQAGMKRLRELSTASQARLGQTIALYRNGDHAGATTRQQLAPGRAPMDEIRNVVTGMKAQESELLRSRKRATVRQAGDASQALAVLAVTPRVDLLFTDIVMPGMNGRQLSDRARETHPDLKMLYTTGFTRNAVVHNGVLDPGVALNSKPFTIEELAAKVRRVLDGSRANRPK